MQVKWALHDTLKGICSCNRKYTKLQYYSHFILSLDWTSNKEERYKSSSLHFSVTSRHRQHFLYFTWWFWTKRNGRNFVLFHHRFLGIRNPLHHPNLINLRIKDISAITILVKSWMYQHLLLDPSELVLHRSIHDDGLGLMNVKMRSLALLVRTFLKPSSNPNFRFKV